MAQTLVIVVLLQVPGNAVFGNIGLKIVIRELTEVPLSIVQTNQKIIHTFSLAHHPNVLLSNYFSAVNFISSGNSNRNPRWSYQSTNAILVNLNSRNKYFNGDHSEDKN